MPCLCTPCVLMLMTHITAAMLLPPILSRCAYVLCLQVWEQLRELCDESPQLVSSLSARMLRGVGL